MRAERALPNSATPRNRSLLLWLRSLLRPVLVGAVTGIGGAIPIVNLDAAAHRHQRRDVVHGRDLEQLRPARAIAADGHRQCRWVTTQTTRDFAQRRDATLGRVPGD